MKRTSDLFGHNEQKALSRRAAMYVRMSTDNQKYSTENQAHAIEKYAERHNIEIVKTYVDSGKSGLTLGGRDALQQLIEDVQAGGIPYSMILVLDVTRWGRFQDADESAYYEYMLKDKMVAIGVFPILKRMKPYRQIEAVTLMNDAGTYSSSYAKALLAATPKEQLVQPDKPKNVKGLTEDQMARMESEMNSLQREYRLIEDNYGTDVLNLTLSKAYLGSWMENARVLRYLAQHHGDILREFQKIVDIASLGNGEAA